MIKNWKTTCFGLAISIYLAVHPLLSTGHVDWHKIRWAAVIAVFGFLVKDYDQTGVK